MRIAMAQMKMEDSIEANFQKSVRAIGEAADGGADLVFFPELQFYPFFPQYRRRDGSAAALSAGHEFIVKIREECKKRKIMASPNLYLEENGLQYDASLLIDAEGELQGISKMVHVTQCPCFYEQDYYTPSNEGFRVYDTPYGKIGIVICFDRHVPESIRTCAVRGADLILVPTANTEGEPLEFFEWEIRVQARQSSVWIAMCNRMGREGGVNFIGQSLVADPMGEILVKAGGREQMVYADVDLRQSRTLREENPYFTLRRPEWYS